MSQAISLEEATRLIWKEADLLDSQDYDPWLDLWAEDGLYIVPIDKGEEDFASRLNYAYDDAEMRRMRTVRLQSSFSMSALTAATTVRTVSRFTVREERDNEIDVRAAQILVQYRRDNTRTVGADLDFTLRREGDGLKLVKKVVWLANSEDAVSGIAYLL